MGAVWPLVIAMIVLLSPGLVTVTYRLLQVITYFIILLMSGGSIALNNPSVGCYLNRMQK